MSPPSPAPQPQQPIGVFDSGIGGLSILRSLRGLLPFEDYVYLADSGYAPYGERSDAYVQERAERITAHLLAQHHIKALVVACNTATAAAVRPLRQRWPELPIVGVEPALKPAWALTRTGHVAVLATRGTLASQRFAGLLAGAPAGVLVSTQPCDGLAHAIETLDTTKTGALSLQYTLACGPFGPENGQVDTLVLGCTHYPLVRSLIEAQAGPQVRVIDTAEPVARQTWRLLQASGLLQQQPRMGQLSWLTTGSPEHLQSAVRHWLQWDAERCGHCDP